MNDRTIRILAISGSLQSTSANTSILKVVSKMSPEHVTVKLAEGLDALPHFNPEINEEFTSVTNFRQQIKEADGVIICTPEYAFGVPGVLKNALDWLVSSGELNEKPVVAISASALYTGGDKALASLLHTLTALGANKNDHSYLSIGNIKSKISGSGEITDKETINSLQIILNSLLGTIS